MLGWFETTYLDRINALIEQRLKPMAETDLASSGERDLNLLSRHLCISSHSKRIRPLLCLYFHKLLKDNVDDVFPHIGVAAEFIHGASLLHDDIVDEADRRRGKASANRHFGNAQAVLAGDYLLTEAFDLLRPFERQLIDRAIVVVREMTKAAMIELSIRGRVDVGADCLRSIARGKTGALFAWCGFAAGHFCHQHKMAERLWILGERIGLIFQLADDIKDFHGDKHLKDICRDIRNRELSLPILLACNEDHHIKNAFERAFLEENISEEAAVALRDMIIGTSGIAHARMMMQVEVDHVMSDLSHYQNNAGAVALKDLVSTLSSAG